MFTDLFDGPVDVRQAPPPSAMDTPCVAVYERSADKVLGALVVCDLPFAASSGAALGMCPPEEADDAIHARALSASLEDNWREVVNIMAAMFNELGTNHVRLSATHVPPARLPAPIILAAKQPEIRVDLTVSIASYPVGQVAVLLLGPG